MKRPDLTIVIPALNERDRLPKSLERIHGYLQESTDWTSIEIVVVDDGSSDDTAEIVRAMSFSGAMDVTVAAHSETEGKGAAVRTGFGHSSGAWVLLTDADLSAPIEGLALLKDAAQVDGVAIGSRAVERRLVEANLLRESEQKALMDANEEISEVNARYARLLQELEQTKQENANLRRFQQIYE